MNEPKQNLLAPMTPEQRDQLRQEVIRLELEVAEHDAEIDRFKEHLKSHRDAVKELRDEQRRIAESIDE